MMKFSFFPKLLLSIACILSCGVALAKINVADLKPLFSDNFDAKVKVVQKSIFFVTDVYKCRVKSGHNFFHLSEVNVANRKLIAVFILMQFRQVLVFQQGNINALRT